MPYLGKNDVEDLCSDVDSEDNGPGPASEETVVVKKVNSPKTYAALVVGNKTNFSRFRKCVTLGALMWRT